jgi:hypothetical protein
MNDDFMLKGRPLPRTEFKNSLYSHLVSAEEKKKRVFPIFVVRYAVAALFLGFGLLMVISQPVRADFLALIRQIAGFNVNETTESPISQVTGTPYLIITEPTLLPLIDIQDAPFEFTLPQYLPEGFVFSRDYVIADSQRWVMLTASKADDYEITMLVELSDANLVVPAGIASASEISLNGTPALLIQGGWSADSQWQNNRGLELQWHQEGLRYDLHYTKKGTNGVIVPFAESELADRLDELIKVAESIK